MLCAGIITLKGKTIVKSVYLIQIEMPMYRKELTLLLLFSALLHGCIKDEPANPEADIEHFSVDQQLLVSNTFIDQANSKIYLYIKDSAYSRGCAPVLTLSKGASVVPASGDSISFDQDIKYTVTSQSGESRRVYTVVPVHNLGNYTFTFERWGTNPASAYEFPVEPDGVSLWSSGNPGAALAGLPKDPKAYPTRSTTDKYEGSTAAEMVTLKGTSLTEIVGIKMIPGSIFYGNFNSQQALVNPLAATEFGQPFKGKAVRFSGYYKYTPGENFQDKSGNIIPGAVDSCAIYAVLYKGTQRLNGTNILTSDRIIAKAVLSDGSAKADYTHFDIPFIYTPDADLSGDLMLAIVASSSHKGDQYQGAVGSRLVIDNFVITRK